MNKHTIFKTVLVTDGLTMLLMQIYIHYHTIKEIHAKDPEKK